MRIQQFLLLPILILLVSCSTVSSSTSVQKVGLLLEDTIDDQGWNSKGFQGLLNIHANMDIDVVYKEDIHTESEVELAVHEFFNEDVNLVFGHGHIFSEFFTNIGEKYPDIHFVSFNGEVQGDNVTSLRFSSYAMGFFAGMFAAVMSKTDHVGIIAAHQWQPEVSGFEHGAKLGRSKTEVHIEYVGDWTNEEKALNYFHELKNKGVDIFYPAGDGYHIAVIEEAKKEGLFVIGYIADQSDLGESTVLTSTIQHVDQLYELVATQHRSNEIKSGNISYDFQDGVISLGSFSPEVPERIVEQITEAVDAYMETGKLPEKPFS